jgi:succinate dehydrogenase/fumarate reductase cytochrome b subunit
VLGLVLAVFGRGWMDRHDAVWWFWTCVAGFALGLVGVWFVRRRRARLGRRAAARGD